MRLFSELKSRFCSEKQKYVDPIVNASCDYFEVNNWVVSDFVVKELLPIVGVRPFPLNELVLMTAAVCRLKPEYIFEWGTHIGKSARIFYETCRHFQVAVEIHSIDLPADAEHEENPGFERGKLVKGLPGIFLHIGDGLNDSLKIIDTLVAKNPKLLFFVDGDHEYSSVRRELEGILQHAPSASILLHDTFCQSESSGYNIGPFKAIEDVLTRLPDVFSIYRQDLGLPGMILLVNKCLVGEKA